MANKVIMNTAICVEGKADALVYGARNKEDSVTGIKDWKETI